MVSVFSVTAPHFTDESNITNILTQITINLIMATGMTFVILIGGIDLSVGSVMALCAMVAGLVLKIESLPVPVAIAAAVAASVIVGMVCGFMNGFVSSFWNVPSFIVTLGMLNIARGLRWRSPMHARCLNFPTCSTISEQRRCLASRRFSSSRLRWFCLVGLF